MNAMRVKAVAAKTGLSVSNIWYKVSKGDFPKPFPLGPRQTVWDEADVDDWLISKKEKAHEAQ